MKKFTKAEEKALHPTRHNVHISYSVYPKNLTAEAWSYKYKKWREVYVQISIHKKAICTVKFMVLNSQR